jgi:hypothetical protein
MKHSKALRRMAAAAIPAIVATAGLMAAPGHAMASTSGTYDIFSVSPSGNLYENTWNGGWGGWTSLGNDSESLTGSPGVVYDATDGSYHVFAIGGSNGNVYQVTIETSGTKVWQDLGGSLEGGVSATYNNGQFDIFSVSTTGVLYQDTWNGGWSGWDGLGYDSERVTGAPGVTYDSSDGSYHVFTVGATSGNVYQDTIASSGAQTWQDLGGTLQGGLSARNANGVFVIFSVSPSGNLYEDEYNSGWSGWESHGNDSEALTGSPGFVFSGSDDSNHVYAIGGNGNVYQDTISSSGSNTWQNLGGVLQGGLNALYLDPTAPTSGTDCTSDDSCNQLTFADLVLSDIGAPVTSANEYAFETWERAEGGGYGCPLAAGESNPWPDLNDAAGNPLDTTETEPGSTSINSANVQAYADGNGETCWYWGVTATVATLDNGYYSGIISALDSPSTSDTAQCDDLATAVGNSPWGTGNFSSDC